ncbi:WD40 repeat domain-containing protein [Candidatus Bipolaricaulota bacterium]|nr:WD40 repeat domain-containing protein [Candidatus Bipolaricaulota bacterium]
MGLVWILPVLGTEVIGTGTVATLTDELAWPTDGAPVFALAYAPDGGLLYGAHGNGVTVWDPADGSTLRSWPAHPGYAAGLDISPDGSLLATAGSDGIVRIWDAASGDLQRELSPAGTHAVAFSHSGGLIASVNRDAGLRVWEVDSGNLVWTTDIEGSVFSVAFSPDDSTLVTAHGLPDFAVRTWSVETSELIWEAFAHEADAHVVGFSPNGEAIASVGADTLVTLWDAASGDVLRTLRGHTQPLFELLFLNDELLATGDGEGTIRLWSLETGRTVKILRGHRSEVCALAISPDGTTLASASFGMEAILWGVP